MTFKAERPAFILNHETLRKQLNTFWPWLPHLKNEWNNSHNNEEDVTSYGSVRNG